jgi:hypothetical protein
VCIKVSDEKYKNAKRLCQIEVALVIDEVFVNYVLGNE